MSTLHASSRGVIPPTRIPFWVLCSVDEDHFWLGPAAQSTQYISTWKFYNLLVLGVGIKNNHKSACEAFIATSYIVWRCEATYFSINYGTQFRKSFVRSYSSVDALRIVIKGLKSFEAWYKDPEKILHAGVALFLLVLSYTILKVVWLSFFWKSGWACFFDSSFVHICVELQSQSRIW